MVMGKRRTIVFLGATAIEVALAKLFGFGISESLAFVLIGNFLVVQFADAVYKNKIKFLR